MSTINVARTNTAEQRVDACPTWCNGHGPDDIAAARVGEPNGLAHHSTRIRVMALPAVAVSASSSRAAGLWEACGTQYRPEAGDERVYGPAMIEIDRMPRELTSGEARSLAAQLVALADLVESA